MNGGFFFNGRGKAFLENDSKFKVRLAVRLMNKHTIGDMMGERGMDLIRRYLDEEPGNNQQQGLDTG